MSFNTFGLLLLPPPLGVLGRITQAPIFCGIKQNAHRFHQKTSFSLYNSERNMWRQQFKNARLIAFITWRLCFGYDLRCSPKCHQLRSVRAAYVSTLGLYSNKEKSSGSCGDIELPKANYLRYYVPCKRQQLLTHQVLVPRKL